ncbi:three-Cys-motif partner protein TcmP [Sphingobacterium siyangense]|uniref:three-Cys-motif partner protein TcmP n=1 Tax=Sphingobacterium siyangense TaxID=459529 RepID=UPI003DA31F99
MKKIKDINRKPFDGETLAKLDIFEDYAEAWIPTFVMAKYEEIHIFDFFAGSGFDSSGTPGSPMRILQQIKRFIQHIFDKGTTVVFHVNEFDDDKYNELIQSCDNYLNDNQDVKNVISIRYNCRDFSELFDELYPLIKKYPSLVYLDQYGVKFLSEKYIKALENTETTDFLYFVSSSHFLRFGSTMEFQKHFNFDVEQAKKEPYKFIHRNLIKQMRDSLLKDSELKLYPFSIKKGNNIHGIIFGAKNIRAIDKFLDIAWRRAPINGDANFDIDDEGTIGQIDIFGNQRMSKKEIFSKKLEDFVKLNKIVTNKDVFIFTLSLGHTRQHGAEVIKNLKTQKALTYIGKSPKIDYKYVKKDLDIVEIKWTR